jgi:hypothetical protein
VLGLGEAVVPLYDISPPLDTIARLGFSLVGYNSLSDASLRAGSDYGVNLADITIPTGLGLRNISVTIWGAPSAASHDAERVCVEPNGKLIFGCSSDAAPASFLTLPVSCTGPLLTTVKVSSLQEPTVVREASVPSLDEHGQPGGMVGCEAPPFEPTLTARPETTTAGSPTGLHVHLHIPQHEEPDGIASASQRDTAIILPAGLTLNPSAAAGLGACTSAQADLHGPGPIGCPADSQVGTVTARTPAVDHPLHGSLYLAKQGENPFGGLLALYLAIEDPLTGVIVKLPGNVQADPATGRLTTTFSDLPQLPIEDVDVALSGGPRASLTTPPTCGTYTTSAQLTPWTSPASPTVTRSDSFPITRPPAGGACPTRDSQLPNAPSFEAGTQNPLAASYSPFLFRVSREPGSQPLGRIDAVLPPGLSGRLTGLEQCSDAEIRAATARAGAGEGALEQAHPSCPPGSQVGTATIGAGSGAPFNVTGRAYLAGPYEGAPVSLAFITPAVAGPFDLGVVLVRAPLYIDEATAQITVRSDPLPQILDGIRLDIRRIVVNADRSQFSLNPTSCDPMAVQGQATSAFGQIVPLSSPFQVGGCRGLAYRPKLTLRLRGSAKRTANPALSATLTGKPGEANTAFAQVKLPKAAFLDNAHIGTICTRVQFGAGPGNGAECPVASVYGRAEAITPLLGYPLKGTVFLRASNHPLPDLVVAFTGPSYQPIHFDLVGRTDSVHGALRNTFEAAPDVPVSKFRLELFGGKRGLVEMSSGFCAHPDASIRLRAHDNATYETKPKVKANCPNHAGKANSDS